jgi:hypothetical protein
MSSEQLNILTSLATFLVLTAAAIAALVQLRHIRANNECSAFSAAFELWYSPQVQASLGFIQNELPAKMEDPAFRRELDTAGPVDRARHPELHWIDFMDNIGVYVMLGNLRENMILHAASQLIVTLWHTLSPTVAIMRRKRGPQLYISFEYLARRAQLWNERYPDGYVPRGFERLPNPDIWLSADQTSSA